MRGSVAIPRDHPRTAILPLENLSAAADAGDILTRILWNELFRSGAVDVVDLGNVNAVLDSLHIRATGSPTADQVRALGGALGVRYVFVGNVLENTKIQTPEGEVPSIGLSLRMVEVPSGRVAWAGMHFRTGDDRETIFGWGRIRSADRLGVDVASELLEEFRKVGRETRERAQTGEGQK